MLIFLHQKPIKKQIALYVAWKSVRHPLVARSHERILLQFFSYTRLKCANEVTPQVINGYSDFLPAIYQRMQFAGAMRQFFRYWRTLGLLSAEFDVLIKEGTIVDISSELSPTMHIEQVKRVRELRGEGLSLMKIKLRMETEDKKPYHLKQIHRWSKYLIPGERSLSTAP